MAEASDQHALDVILSEEDPFTELAFDILNELLTEEQKASYASRGIFDFMRVFCTALKETNNLERRLCSEHIRKLLRLAWNIWSIDKVHAFSAIKLLLEKEIAQDA